MPTNDLSYCDLISKKTISIPFFLFSSLALTQFSRVSQSRRSDRYFVFSTTNIAICEYVSPLFLCISVFKISTHHTITSSERTTTENHEGILHQHTRTMRTCIPISKKILVSISGYRPGRTCCGAIRLYVQYGLRGKTSSLSWICWDVKG